jgi:hypothetical protein
MGRTYIRAQFKPINSEYSRNLARKRQSIIRGSLNKLFVDGYPPVPKIRDKIEQWTGCSIFELSEHLRRGPFVTMLDFRVKESWHLDHVFPVSLIPDSEIYRRNKDKENALTKEHWKNNKELYKLRKKIRMRDDPDFAFRMALSGHNKRLYLDGIKRETFDEILGCTINEAIEHFEQERNT